MSVITISSELGAGGVEIGARVAADLGYQLVDEHAFDRILRQYGLTRFNEVYDSAPTILDLVRSENLLIVSMLNEIVEAVAKRGDVVLLSRVGFAVLGPYADVLTVHIAAPFEQRAQAVWHSEGLAELAAAEARVHDDDNVHHAFVQRFYDRRSDDPSAFGLVVNTGSLPPEEAVKQIVAAAHAVAQKAAEPGSTTTAVLEVEPVLGDTVAQVLAGAMG